MYEISKQNNLEQTLRDIVDLQNKIEEIRKVKTEGSIVRSKIRWVEEGEKSSKFFFALEKRNFK